jgi:hypothetical protein
MAERSSNSMHAVGRRSRALNLIDFRRFPARVPSYKRSTRVVRLNGGSTIIPFNGLDANWQSRVMNRLCAPSLPGTGAVLGRFWH